MNEDNTAMTPTQAVATYNAILKHGEDAWLKWTVSLGPWIIERTELAKERAQGTRGPAYAKHLQKAVGKFYEIYKKLSDSGTLSFLMRIMENLDAVNDFRNRLPEEDRPSSPGYIWDRYQASLHAPEPEEDEADEKNKEQKAESKKKRATRRKADKEELSIQYEALREKLEECQMSIYPEVNAQRVWFQIKQIMNPEGAIELARATIKELDALVTRVATPEEWSEPKPKARVRSKIAA